MGEPQPMVSVRTILEMALTVNPRRAVHGDAPPGAKDRLSYRRKEQGALLNPDLNSRLLGQANPLMRFQGWALRDAPAAIPESLRGELCPTRRCLGLLRQRGP